MTWIVVGLLGLIGVWVRFALAQSAVTFWGISTTAMIAGINVLGSFLIGVLFSLKQFQVGLSETWVVGLSLGFLGGFTTFSAYSWDTVRLIQNGEMMKGFGCLVAIPLLSVVSCWIGFQLVKWFFSGGP